MASNDRTQDHHTSEALTGRLHQSIGSCSVMTNCAQSLELARTISLPSEGQTYGICGISRSWRDGLSLAGHLRNKGATTVTVYNRTAAKAEQWVAHMAASLP